MDTFVFILIALFTFNNSFCESASSRQIPVHLLECYRNGSVGVSSPQNKHLLIEILSKIERQNKNYNVRMISASLLHKLRLDGIQRIPNVQENANVLPYRASGFQFSKYSILVDYLIPSENIVDLTEGLTQTEICALHLMISTTVNFWERGDEGRICPLSMSGSKSKTVIPTISFNTTRSSTKHSRCPIELGVMQTLWGDVSPGTLISGVSAALEPQNVQMKDIFDEVFKDDTESKFEFDQEVIEISRGMSKNMFTQRMAKLIMDSDTSISNILAATITGDLAEMAIIQGPFNNYSMGPPGKWNDTLLPRTSYLLQAPPVRWEMTDAEILAGIDGFIIASHLKEHESNTRMIRLSQIIDLYYSNNGLPLDSNVRACNRKRNFEKLLAETNLQEQTLNVVNLLWMKLSNIYMTPEAIKEISNNAVQAFENYWPKVVDNLPGCSEDGIVNPIDVILAMDHTWNKYQTEQLISALTESLDISYQGSRLSFIHGTTGEWISQSTQSVLELFENISNSTDRWVSRLDLPNVLTTIVNRLENETAEEKLNFKVAAPPHVVILMTPMTKWQQSELDRSKTIVNTIRSSYTDVYFIFVTPDIQVYEHLATDRYSDYHVDTSATDVKTISEKLTEMLLKKRIPKRFIGPPCDLEQNAHLRRQYEDYIYVGQMIVYRIHPVFLMNSKNIKAQFQGTGQGELSVCISRYFTEDAADSCKIVSDQNDVNFEISNPCQSDDCLPIFFIIRARSSSVNCADKDCRYPHQIRYIIRHEGLQCMGANRISGAVSLINNYNKIYFVILTMLHLLIINKIVK